jgi:hypothetical protein
MNSLRLGWLSTPTLALIAAFGGSIGADGFGQAGVVHSDRQESCTGIIPGRGLHLYGRFGEPFADASRTLPLANQTDHAIVWQTVVSAPWLQLQGPQSGSLRPGELTDVVIQLDRGHVSRLEPGHHRAEVRIMEAGTTVTLNTLDITVDVYAATVDGWTVFTPSPDTRTIYVSASSGNDANNGLSEATPKRTIEAGMTLLRHGFPDWLLLKRGDVFLWSDLPTGGIKWETSGRSATEPTLFSSYGPSPARPRLITRGQPGIRMTGGGNAPAILEHVAIVGLDLTTGRRNTSSGSATGIRMQMPVNDILIEDCKLSRFTDGIIAQLTNSELLNVKIRRNVINDCYARDGSHAQGIYCDEVTGLLIEENLIDHGGWTETDPNADGPDIFKHDIYIQGDAQQVVVRGNMLFSGSSHGLQLRSGGVAEGNLFARNAVSMLLAGDGAIRRNVFLDGRDIDPSLPRRQALHVQDVPNSVIVDANVFGTSTPSSTSKAISLLPLDLGGGNWVGIHNPHLSNNVVFNWGGETIDIRNFANTTTNIFGAVFDHNDFQNGVDGQELIQHQSTNTAPNVDMAFNRFFSNQAPTNAWARVGNNSLSLQAYLNLIGDTTSVANDVTYPSPDRTISTYQASLGGTPTHEAFVQQALLQSKTFWRPQYTAAAVNAYIRAGFGLAP